MAKNTFINYYDKFSLSRTMSEAEIKTELGKVQRDIIRRQGTTNPSDTATLQLLQDNMVLVREAIRELTKPQNRAAYDKQLDAFLQQGGQNQTKPATRTSGTTTNYLQKAKDFFAKENYELAARYAKDAINSRVNDPEAYEILCKSMFIQGDYDDALQVADTGASAFGSNLSLQWLTIRFRVQMEQYQEAQLRINNLRKIHGPFSQLAAEQVYLYYFAEKDEQGKNFIDKFMASHPSDANFRKQTANNLIDISHQMYTYDADADMLLITEKDEYERALKLVTQANQLYQDPYTLQELETVKQFGNKEFDKTHRGARNVYYLAGIFMILAGIYTMFGSNAVIAENTMFGCVILGAIGLFSILLGFIVHRISMRPVWQIYRDEFRGFHESDDKFLYTILAAPWEFSKMIGWSFFG